MYHVLKLYLYGILEIQATKKTEEKNEGTQDESVILERKIIVSKSALCRVENNLDRRFDSYDQVIARTINARNEREQNPKSSSVNGKTSSMTAAGFFDGIPFNPSHESKKPEEDQLEKVLSRYKAIGYFVIAVLLGVLYGCLNAKLALGIEYGKEVVFLALLDFFSFLLFGGMIAALDEILDKVKNNCNAYLSDMAVARYRECSKKYPIHSVRLQTLTDEDKESLLGLFRMNPPEFWMLFSKKSENSAIFHLRDEYRAYMKAEQLRAEAARNDSSGCSSCGGCGGGGGCGGCGGCGD